MCYCYGNHCVYYALVRCFCNEFYYFHSSSSLQVACYATTLAKKISLISLYVRDKALAILSTSLTVKDSPDLLNFLYTVDLSTFRIFAKSAIDTSLSTNLAFNFLIFINFTSLPVAYMRHLVI